MFCHKCGTQIEEGALFCHKCGTKINNELDKNNVTTSTKIRPGNGIKCPNCHSSDLIAVSETKTDISGGGYGVGKGCCGWILLGPFGLLCGLCGTGLKSQSKTLNFWVCKSCGHKFRSEEDKKAEENAEIQAVSVKMLEVSIILYIAGNLFADYGIKFLGIPSWLYITMGVLGIILGAGGILASMTQNKVEWENEDMEIAHFKKCSFAALSISISGLIAGILFAITDIRFFWVPAWVYILFGILGMIISGIMALASWALGLKEDEIKEFEDKYDPLIEKIVGKIWKK